MSDPEKPLRASSVVGIILNAADRIRQTDADLAGELVAARRLEAEAIKRAIRAEKIAKEALQRCLEDLMTGCLNRNYFEKYANEGFDSYNDDGNVGLVFVDINDLKLTNDNHGHEAGDRMLKDMAELLKSGGRKSGNTIVRLGGDEFVIISKKDLQRSGGESDAVVADDTETRDNDVNFEESLEKMMERMTLEGRKTYPSLSFAYGIAVYDRVLDQNVPEDPHMSVEVENIGDTSLLAHTLMRADANMYIHKQEKARK